MSPVKYNGYPFGKSRIDIESYIMLCCSTAHIREAQHMSVFSHNPQ